MKKKLNLNLAYFVVLESFILFPEYFFSVSILYILIVLGLVSYNVYGLMVQKALSECIALILCMVGYLILNDNLWIFNVNVFMLHKSIVNDCFAIYAKLLICLFSTFYFVIVANFFKKQKLTFFEYLLILAFSVLGLLLMCSSNDLLIAYLAIELSSLSFYILAAFRKKSIYSVESGLKYFVAGAVSSSFFLLGSSFVYGVFGSINFCDFYDFDIKFSAYQSVNEPCYDVESNLMFYVCCYFINQSFKYSSLFFDINFVEIGLTCILFSLFIKLALAPFHLWGLDVWEGAPTNSTFFFGVVTKLSIFILLIRICYKCFSLFYETWQYYCFWVSVLSVFVGSFGGLKQRRVKSLLAYSSMSHMGYILMAFSTVSFLGVQIVLFYLFVYMLSGLAMWQIILLLKLKKKKFRNKYNKELSDFVLLRKSNAALAFLLSLTMLSIAGVPPLVGFLAKINVFLSTTLISYFFIVLGVIFCSVISTFYYLRVIKIVFFENILVGHLYYPIKTTKTIILSTCIFLLVFFFLNPKILYLFTYKIILFFQ